MVKISPSGILAIQMSSGGLRMPNVAGGLRSVMNHYEEYMHTSNWQFGTQTHTGVQLSVIKVGRIVQCTIHEYLTVGDGQFGNAGWIMNTALPTRFRPDTDTTYYVKGMVSSAMEKVSLKVYVSGSLNAYATDNDTAFVGTGAHRVYHFSISWIAAA